MDHPYHGGRFPVYVRQIIALYTLKLHSIMCQLRLNKAGREKPVKKTFNIETGGYSNVLSESKICKTQTGL